MNRKTIAVAILLMWVAGFAWMVRRNSGGDASRRLTEAAIRIQPATLYYSVFYRGRKIGAASSSIDTLVAALVSEEYFTGSYPSGDSLVKLSARLRSRMTRGLRLTNVSVDLDRDGKRWKMSAFVQNDSTLIVVEGSRADSMNQHIIGLHAAVLPPGLVGAAMMLGERANVGHTATFVVFNPMDRKPERREVTVAAESVFTVVDSAGRAAAGWQAAHTDTVRAWRFGGDTSGLTAWVDAEGRVVEASTRNGLLLRRTAFELAFDRVKGR